MQKILVAVELHSPLSDGQNLFGETKKIPLEYSKGIFFVLVLIFSIPTKDKSNSSNHDFIPCRV